MKRIAASEAENRLDALLDHAQHEPIVIQRQGRDVAVVLSMTEFERMRSGNVAAFLEASRALAAEAKANGLTEEKLAALLADKE